jgi:hypothetical protein
VPGVLQPVPGRPTLRQVADVELVHRAVERAELLHGLGEVEPVEGDVERLAGQLLEVEDVPRGVEPEQARHRERTPAMAACGLVHREEGHRRAVQASGALHLGDDPGGQADTVVEPVGQPPQRDVPQDLDARQVAV